MKILFLDDEEDIGDIFKEHLSDAGFEVDGINMEAVEESSADRFAIDENPDIMNPKTAKVGASCPTSGGCS